MQTNRGQQSLTWLFDAQGGQLSAPLQLQHLQQRRQPLHLSFLRLRLVRRLL